MSQRIRLGLNIDHIATVRNARGGHSPDPVRGARLAIAAGVDGITAHLREDRRHVRDGDITALANLCNELNKPLNFEMAVTEEMLSLAENLRPHAACLVPERRQERTTEGGLDVAGRVDDIGLAVARLTKAGVRSSLFIATDPAQVSAAEAIKAPVVEFHTGALCDAFREGDMALYEKELKALRLAAEMAHKAGIEVHAGHGIDYDTVTAIAQIPQVKELNIGHFLIGEAIFTGLETSIHKMRLLMDAARGLTSR
ncbi:pyridoxine 5'-phosphate synthase [Asticcacaulis sp. ZE23SCel15]|uniref:pyridoxine 5'-phosphate synthase n=1 Tax=Asticcacaulis sp. ZE23SCel15 TaxID=3059027 RepID=UPI002660539F|nr:pyridoxine 5'-phosphate synthase [Asticcacaulis sp. ZE23SCel15]WKL56483.1 pyridoxine 5'-phosphate synthase [Asticcacaulis sp. ZE23SCel15]